MPRTLCVVTGTRAEFGLLRWLMSGIRADPALRIQIVATGMHLSPEFGLTYREIEKEDFVIDRKVEMLMSSDSPVGIAKSMGLGLIGFADAFAELTPDMVVLLGDRFEILAAAAAAVARIPIAHIHGGETTEGSVDEGFRHAVSKMSHLHFVAAEEYGRRVRQMGEDGSRVFVVGAPGLDGICKLPLLDRAELESALNFKFGHKNLMVTFHPVTLERATAAGQMRELLQALGSLEDTHLIFTLPNADTDGRILIDLVRDFVASHANARAFTSLGQLKYLSCLRHVNGVVGNSSSGLIEAPSLHKGTINIGDRQKGRLKAASVIDCAPTTDDIQRALQRLYSTSFQASLASVANPYGDGGASERILKVLRSHPLEGLLKKRFHDLPPPATSDRL